LAGVANGYFQLLGLRERLMIAESNKAAVYKPLQGTLSDEEYAILDELTSLVLCGEIALERLQRAGELRASTHGREYANHYDLAGSLLDLGRANLDGADVNEAAIGRVDVLYELLKATGLNTPDELAKYVRVLHSDFEKRPLSEQIVDQILAEKPSRYATYEQIRLLEAPIAAITSEVSRGFPKRGDWGVHCSLNRI
jgi:hypothetical protein